MALDMEEEGVIWNFLEKLKKWQKIKIFAKLCWFWLKNHSPAFSPQLLAELVFHHKGWKCQKLGFTASLSTRALIYVKMAPKKSYKMGFWEFFSPLKRTTLKNQTNQKKFSCHGMWGLELQQPSLVQGNKQF